MPLAEIQEIIQEFESIGTFDQTTLSHWNDLMSEHNRTISRGERMQLPPCSATNMDWIKFRSLDLFMLRMQGMYLAKLLADFSSFGERVVRLIQESPTSPCWVIGGPLVVERMRWYQLCYQMMTLPHVLGVADQPSVRQRRPWPDRDLLEAAAARARGVFGSFARADTAMPSIRARIGPTPAAAAEPPSRTAKRRQDDSAAACPPPRAACARAKVDPEPRGPHGAQALREQRSHAPAVEARSNLAAPP